MQFRFRCYRNPYYNGRRPHSSLGGLTPDEAYAAIGAGGTETQQLAA